MDLNSNCRLCWTKDVELINVFEEKGIQLNISTIVGQHLWIQMQKDDLFSEFICTTCWWKVEGFHTFYTQIYELHKSENPIIDEKKNIKSEIVDTTNDNSNGKVSRKITDDDHTNSSIKLEVEIDNENDVESISSRAEDSNDSIESFRNDSESEDQDYVEKTKPKRLRSRATKSKCTKNTTTREKIESNRKQRDAQNEQIQQFCRMECDLCSQRFESFTNALGHYRSVHDTKGYLKCCEKKFFERWRAIKHIRLHINPESIKCEICGKVFCETRTLNNHMATHSNPEQKIFKCDKCPKSFQKKFQLNQHQILHRERSFRCDHCGKCCVSQGALTSHIRSVHEGAYQRICDICAKTFKSKTFFEQHMKIAHSEIPQPKVQCPQCGCWLKHEHSLRSHLRLHVEEKNLYICNVCGKQAPNRAALQKHKNFAHTLERTHVCEICSKAFKRALTLKEHMTTHTGEVLYSCPFCPTTFNSSANYHAHKKKMHPIEWAESKNKK